jgi:protein JBTS26
VLTTWGDLNYLGLAGIEVYDMEGKLINISKISACPPDVNVLPGYGNDPRVVENLVDGSYFTNDDMNVWLTPFTSGEDHTITLDFGKKVAISMIRIWNYNKSRIHAYRGARLITAELDNRLIFKGEIKKGPGHTKDPEACCEIILFTDSDSVLTKIDSNDWINQHDIVNGMDDT